MTARFPINLTGLPIEVLRELRVRVREQIRKTEALRPRGPLRKHDYAAVIQAVRDGTAIKDCGIPYMSAWIIVRNHERATGERLPRLKSGQKIGERRNQGRSLAIVDAYRELGTLELASKQFGVSRERVRQIIVRYERETGEKIPRTINIGQHLLHIKKPRVLWRCAGGCGKERMMLASAAALHAMCNRCGTGSRITDELIEDTIAKILANPAAHGKWGRLAKAAGFEPRAYSALQIAVYTALQRQGRHDTIAALWPDGIPHWMQRFTRTRNAAWQPTTKS
jgi:molybdenum-dependent DNA-binding transcriptional regulator ModE